MAKSVQIVLNMKDQFTRPLKKATNDVKTMERTLKKASNSVKKFGAGVKGMAIKTAKYGFAAATATAGVFIKQSVDAAKAQIEAETKLSAVLKNTKGMTDESIESIKKYSGELQKTGVIGDEVSIAGVQQLGTYQLQAETLKTLMPGMNDLLAQQKGLNATQGDAVQIGNLMGKVMTGQVGALRRVGINFNEAQEKVLKFGTEQEKAGMLAEVLKMNVGGVNKALANTDQGKIQQVVNAYGDMKEEVGKRVLPILGNLSGWFATKIPIIQQKILMTADKVESFVKRSKPQIDSFKNGIKDTIRVATTMYNFISTNWSTIAPIITTIVVAYGAYKAIMIATQTATIALTTATAIKSAVLASGATAVNLITVAQWAWNAAMTANPIGLVITAIATLIGIGIALYKNWDKIKVGASALWNKMKEACPLFNLVEQGVKAVVNIFFKVKDAIIAAKDALCFWNKTKPEDKTLNVNTKSVVSTTQTGTSYGRASQYRSQHRPPRHALGTSYFQGGITGIAEGNRPETIVLPSGSKIIPHGQDKRNSQKVEVNLTIQGNVIGNQEFMEETGRYVGREVMLALNNM